jgi:predicted nuclease with TOPRIM domain
MDESKMMMQKIMEGIQVIGSEVKALRAEMDGKFNHMHERMDRMDARLNIMDTRLDRMDAKLNMMDTRLDRMDGRLNRIEETMVTKEEFHTLQKDLELTYHKATQNELELNRIKK